VSDPEETKPKQIQIAELLLKADKTDKDRHEMHALLRTLPDDEVHKLIWLGQTLRDLGTLENSDRYSWTRNLYSPQNMQRAAEEARTAPHPGEDDEAVQR
jgi:hypothetical protein